MARTYTVAHLGCGGRGRAHIQAIAHAGPRLRLAGICDLDRERVRQAQEDLATPAAAFHDARTMLAQLRPDIFSFTTQPALREALLALAIDHGVKAVAMEKPMALTLAEARRLCARADDAGVRLMVSHQHKYAAHWRAVRALIARGDIGEVRTIHATSKGWMMHYATHLIDYAMWLNGGHAPVWAVGHAHGRGRLADNHPSPDYLMGQLEFANGVRAIIECGTHAPHHSPARTQEPTSLDFWMNAGATVVGTQGMAWIRVAHGWSAVTMRGQAGSADDVFRGVDDTIPFHLEIADWLDDPARLHPCRAEIALRGHEAMLALCASAIESRPVALPYARDDEPLARLAEALP